ncbi:hypothetical protein Bca52824_089079 [Brassica carinata]|uniref:Phorbol-ester/DAG-type domain-containing protein n=1 Tax=Brassica carinata TaxID=52824 RepID=A0A8X7TQ55_BRACI|nr:hypothetical protein Bca52824_089079 [Brassica carinata]
MEILKKIYSLYSTRGHKCDGCNLGEDCYSDGYRCIRSGLFFHKECATSNQDVCNAYHPQHMLKIKVVSNFEDVHGECKICRGNLPKMYYYCSICDFAIDLICARKEVVKNIDVPNTHKHRLSLVPKMIMFSCHICQLVDDRFPYACDICGFNFHKDCAESTPELSYSCHPKHHLKRLTRVPSYTNGKCCLCKSKLHILFYHCSICNFSVDVECAKNPPPLTLDHPKAHEHQLTLLPQRIFVCNACGMDDDPNPYICLQCNFMVHRNCIDIPHIIKISRHVHRISYNDCLEAGDWKCEVCLKEINWTCGAYSCSKCPDFAIHVRCATRFGIWDGIELESILEDTTNSKAYEVIEEGVIKHFIHKNHTLKLKEGSDANGKSRRCTACTYPIFSTLFYDCTVCDYFIIHQKCADLPKKKIDSFYKMSMTLVSNSNELNLCDACQNYFEGFMYISDNGIINLDVRCGSISEPFVHEGHPHHSLYINYSKKDKLCNACGDKACMVFSCEECDFVLDVKCSILPKMVKHKNDKDHFLTLCYGEKTREQYWCEVCEEDLNPEKWFYSCDHCGVTLHIKCTFGDFIWINPGGEAESIYMVIPNNYTSRPVCNGCDSRCQYPFILKYKKYILCSLPCFKSVVGR